MSKDLDEFLNQIPVDLERIDNIIKNGTKLECLKLHRELDARYQTCIKDWYLSMWGVVRNSNSTIYIEYACIEDSHSEIVENLEMMRTKIETYHKYRVNAIDSPTSKQQMTQINVTTNVSVNITFEQARSEVTEMSSLTDEQTREVLEQIDEIERIIKTGSSKKSKWEQIKPVLKWLADKSYDLGKTILPLLLKIEQ